MNTKDIVRLANEIIDQCAVEYPDVDVAEAAADMAASIAFARGLSKVDERRLLAALGL